MTTKDQLATTLSVHGIPINQWGMGGTKSLSDLFDEIEKGETMLSIVSGILVRTIKVAAVVIYHNDRKRGLQVLAQTFQIFNHGGFRELSRESSISEKILGSETPKAAAKRAFKEELGFDNPPSIVSLFTFTKGPVDLGSYPGLLTVYHIHFFTSYIPDRLYKPEGYKEETPQKTSFYCWKSATLC